MESSSAASLLLSAIGTTLLVPWCFLRKLPQVNDQTSGRMVSVTHDAGPRVLRTSRWQCDLCLAINGKIPADAAKAGIDERGRPRRTGIDVV